MLPITSKYQFTVKLSRIVSVWKQILSVYDFYLSRDKDGWLSER